MDGWKNKMYSLIKGPGWSPGSPWTGFIEQVPDVIKFNSIVFNYVITIFT